MYADSAGKLRQAGEVKNRRGTRVRFRPDPKIFGAKAARNAFDLELKRPDQVPFAVMHRPTEHVIGSTSYMNIRPEHRGLEIGCTWIGSAWRGTGVNASMKRLMLAHAFETLGAIRAYRTALDMAITHRQPPAGVIFHSDRGAQYTSSEFDSYCRRHNIRRSLGRTGICYDNAVSESFFATYKKELIHTRPWPTMADLTNETRDWIENYYNTVRRHSTLGYLTPREYELGYREISQLAA